MSSAAMRVVLDDETLAKAERLHKQGLEWVVIAARLGCDAKALRKARRRAQGRAQYQRKVDEAREAARAASGTGEQP